jgi:N-acyl homoserine lactone hydrolase
MRVVSGATGAHRGILGAVAVLSTGTAQIHPEHMFGSRKPLYWWILTSRQWCPPRPINVYVIEHADGLVLFDTGQDRAALTDPHYYPGGPIGFMYHRLTRFQLGPDATLAPQLERLGYSLSDVRKVVLSHLHQDHVGGLPQLTHAEIVVSGDEWRELSKPLPAARGLLRRHIELPGLRWQRIRFPRTDDPTLAPFSEAFDLMDDGSLTLLPTPGHTRGSLSMLVRRENGSPLLLVGDVTYTAQMLELGQLPGVGDRGWLRVTAAKVRQLKAHLGGLTILPAHDPEAAEHLSQAGGHVRSPN